MKKYNSEIEASTVIAKNHGIIPSALLEWAHKFNVDLVKNGHKIANTKICSFDLVADVIAGEFDNTKKYLA